MAARWPDLDLGEGRCPCCQELLQGRELSLCANCSAPYHSKCCAYLGSCAIFGCCGRTFLYIGRVDQRRLPMIRGANDWDGDKRRRRARRQAARREHEMQDALRRAAARMPAARMAPWWPLLLIVAIPAFFFMMAKVDFRESSRVRVSPPQIIVRPPSPEEITREIRLNREIWEEGSKLCPTCGSPSKWCVHPSPAVAPPPTRPWTVVPSGEPPPVPVPPAPMRPPSWGPAPWQRPHEVGR